MIIKADNFNIMQIAESGQCFRMNKLQEKQYSLIAYGRYIELYQIDNETVEISCTEDEFHAIWENYFDLDYDYSHIIAMISQGEDEFLKEAVKFGSGIRILRQEPFEMMISYIISQNKNIPAIKNCIELICKHYGTKNVLKGKGELTYYSFPTPEKLAQAKKEDLRQLKTGYRDEYIIQAAQAVQNRSIELDCLIERSYEETIKTLKKIHGIGEKVANCIALYGLHHIEAFPIDVWIARILKDIYHGSFDPEKYQGYAGIVQQYMFYYMRSKANLTDKSISIA